ncbi:small GTP-binding protein, putative [Trichomonas vaginalis G3]|uniref:Small GTP-binding protein, putative n=1 Tax=Trichomonas vaginalis (strain ATCC PRA-98 / G3) TaxID=412133 RepID=A2EDH4_TRIV3|nr:GTPase protein [Trichomonas vaginalis G3]EAY09338.1 small GTP-binding protein, putative [Trichomonas vaginalis G3]KAI5510806.1 GTPase protein [Trichomonas vaginalis G3]|eukprot:XP_001321561.1 small GTP-binding protein [Trichomonas vaginalis G3]
MKNAESAGTYKVVMLGNSGVGKTALIERITHDEFVVAHVATVGAQYSTVDFTIQKKKITLELWDTAGQEIFRSLVSFYARDAKGVFLVADITQDGTMTDLERWKDFIKEQAPDAQVILFANKHDLNDQRVVKEEEFENFAKEYNYHYMEGSAKTNEGVQDGFVRMAEIVSEKIMEKGEQESSVKLKQAEESKPCC